MFLIVSVTQIMGSILEWLRLGNSEQCIIDGTDGLTWKNGNIEKVCYHPVITV